MLEEKIKELETVIFLISQNPKKEVVNIYERRLLHEVYRVDYRTLLDLAQASEELLPAASRRVAPSLQSVLTHRRTGTSYLPQSVISKKTEISYDVFENRLLKRFLMMLIELLAVFGKAVEGEI
jgi:hypothetical protein